MNCCVQILVLTLYSFEKTALQGGTQSTALSVICFAGFYPIADFISEGCFKNQMPENRYCAKHEPRSETREY